MGLVLIFPLRLLSPYTLSSMHTVYKDAFLLHPKENWIGKQKGHLLNNAHASQFKNKQVYGQSNVMHSEYTSTLAALTDIHILPLPQKKGIYILKSPS